VGDDGVDNGGDPTPENERGIYFLKRTGFGFWPRPATDEEVEAYEPNKTNQKRESSAHKRSQLEQIRRILGGREEAAAGEAIFHLTAGPTAQAEKLRNRKAGAAPPWPPTNSAPRRTLSIIHAGIKT